MRSLTVAEKCEIVELARNNSLCGVAREFSARHPDRKVAQSTVSRVLKLLSLTGSLHRKPRNTDFAQLNSIELRQDIREYFEANPLTSINQAARHFGMSYSTIWSIIRKKMDFFPYKSQVHQELNDRDHGFRLAFCRHFILRLEINPSFAKNVLWSDECLFKITESFNRQNNR